MTVAGVFFRQPSWERPIAAPASGSSLPTPVVPNGGRRHKLEKLTLVGKTLYREDGSKAQLDLQTYVRLWPTPRVSATRTSRGALTAQHWSAPSLEQMAELAAGILPREFKSPDELTPAAQRMWATPRAADANGSKVPPGKQGGLGLNQQAGGKLSADWVDWLMGWPIGHSGLEPLATAKFRQWQHAHGRS